MGSQVLAIHTTTYLYRCCCYCCAGDLQKNSKMKISLFLSLVYFSACSASPQFGFLGQLFGGGRNRGRGRQNNNNRPSGGGGGRCGGGNQPNHQFQGQGYLVSWRLGCSSFTQGGGEAFCRNNGMRPISLDSSAKEREFLGLVAREGQKYFWTGGKVRGRSISWPSGRSYDDVNWSNTGGANRPQPDNREGDEVCLAVLNNFYNDGVRFHDVSCHHRKPIICEA